MCERVAAITMVATGMVTMVAAIMASTQALAVVSTIAEVGVALVMPTQWVTISSVRPWVKALLAR